MSMLPMCALTTIMPRPSARYCSKSLKKDSSPPGPGGEESFFKLFEQYRAEGRGMIVVSAHIGSIDMLAGSFAYRGLPCYGVADDSAYPELFEAINEQRRRWGITVI